MERQNAFGGGPTSFDKLGAFISKVTNTNGNID
jgi:hypothetical protein